MLTLGFVLLGFTVMAIATIFVVSLASAIILVLDMQHISFNIGDAVLLIFFGIFALLLCYVVGVMFWEDFGQPFVKRFR